MITILENTNFAVFFEREEVSPNSLAWNLYHFGFQKFEDACCCYESLLLATNYGRGFRNVQLKHKVNGVWREID